jgi:transcriptional regulator with XRE-family HTH domain
MEETTQASETSHEARAHVGARLKQKRQDAGLSLRELAALTHIHFSTLCRLEAGIYDLSVARLLLLTHVLGCTHSDVLDNPNAPHAHDEEPTHG